MTRALLCALLLLTACQKDPEGTVTLTGESGNLGMFGEAQISSGDLPPIRVPEAGSYKFAPMNFSSPDEQENCAVEVSLRKYGEAQPLRQATIRPGSARPVWTLDAGLYEVSLNALAGACEYRLIVSQQ